MKYSSIPIAELPTWAILNGVKFNGTAVADNISKDGADKGAGLLATTGISEDDNPSLHTALLLTVPAELVLSKDTVFLCAKADCHLKEVLDSLGDFVQSPRKAILVFLLFQLTITSPGVAASQRGVRGPFADYVAFLPKRIPLPTFYTDEERDLLTGTSLQYALHQKLTSLEREFEELREATSQIVWCQKHWWDERGEEEEGGVNLADWKLVDAMYRSRALDLPGIGHAMVPVLDMANHVSDNMRNARFEVADDNSVLLVKEEGASISQGEEINITYGAGGACETIFSYGFLDDGASSARELFLSMDIPPDDPLRIAKKAAAKEIPGIRLYVNSDGLVQWEGPLVWWSTVNQEDGLDFQVVHGQDGVRGLRTLWRNEEIEPTEFHARISIDEKFDLFRLRATVMVQESVAAQGAELVGSEEAFAEACSQAEQNLRDILNRLRTLELELLTSAYEALEKQKLQLLESDTVVRYLSTTVPNDNDQGSAETGNMEDDFS